MIYDDFLLKNSFFMIFSFLFTALMKLHYTIIIKITYIKYVINILGEIIHA